MAQDEQKPKPTPPPTPPEQKDPYEPLPGENIQEYLKRVPGPVRVTKIFWPDGRVETVEEEDPLRNCEQRHRDRFEWLAKMLGFKE